MKTTPSPKVGILLPTRGLVLKAQAEGRPVDAGPLLALAEQAEEAGLDSVWVGDSLLSKPRLEPVTTLAAVAARTRRVRLGTAALLAALRHPVTLAQALATVDIVSRGRLIVAGGVGGVFTPGQRQEWLTVGVDPASRASRLEEMVQVMKRLWTGEPVTFQGRHFQLQDAVLQPTPAQPGGPPLLLACHHRTGATAQYRRAARYADGFISITDSPTEFAAVASRVADCAREEGRDPANLDSAYYMTVNLDRDPDHARQEAHQFIVRYYGQDFWGNSWGPFGPPEVVARRILEYAQAGARRVIVRFASLRQEEQLSLFVQEVLPTVRGD
ncbi:MAG: LLM class flavin-dependent oxidoreductase [Chloroflexi bacterium]|nr:LLM class flavin-dependent oxidoreductase [Chloroflexota bacterium]